MIITDLDGTLLNNNHAISEFTVDTLIKLRNKGFKVCFCTGRPMTNAEKPVKQASDLQICDFIISNDGNFCKDLTNDEILFMDTISRKDAHTIYDALSSKFDHVHISTNNNLYTLGYESIFDSIIIDNIHEIDGEVINMFVISTTKSEFDIVKEFVDKHDDLEMFITKNSNDMNLYCTVQPANSGKNFGIKKLCELKNIKLSDIYVFGDGTNDICMFKEFDNSIAVENAIDELKSIAKYVTDSNHNDGVANFIVRNIMNEEKEYGN